MRFQTSYHLDQGEGRYHFVLQNREVLRALPVRVFLSLLVELPVDNLLQFETYT